MNEEVEKLLSNFPELQLTKLGRVKCSLSGHEMLCRLDVVRSYVQGKRFSTLKMHSDFDYASLEPLLIPSQRRRRQLFCALTRRYLNRIPEEVRSHISGKRYKKALLEYKCGERELSSEFREKRRNTSKGTQAPAKEAELVGVGADDVLSVVEEEEPEGEEEEEEAMELNEVASDGESESAGGEGALECEGANGKHKEDSEEDGTESSQRHSALSRKKRKRERHIEAIKKLKMRRSKVAEKRSAIKL